MRPGPAQGKPQRVTWLESGNVLARVQGGHLGTAGVPDLVNNALVHVALPRVEVQGDHLQVQGFSITLRPPCRMQAAR